MKQVTLQVDFWKEPYQCYADVSKPDVKFAFTGDFGHDESEESILSHLNDGCSCSDFLIGSELKFETPADAVEFWEITSEQQARNELFDCGVRIAHAGCLCNHVKFSIPSRIL